MRKEKFKEGSLTVVSQGRAFCFLADDTTSYISMEYKTEALEAGTRLRIIKYDFTQRVFVPEHNPVFAVVLSKSTTIPIGQVVYLLDYNLESVTDDSPKHKKGLPIL